MTIQIEEPRPGAGIKFSLFALGFRPFFLLAALSAVSLIFAWLIHLSGQAHFIFYYSAVGWHAHEMLFGYTVAVIAGFLLTAAGNWTGTKVIHGWALQLLSLLWIAGRIAPFIPGLPGWLVATTDFLFLPVVTLLLAVPIIRAKQWSNVVFIIVLLFMAAANVMVHFNILKLATVSAVLGTHMMMYLVIFLIVVMGGRVIPFFTERGVSGSKSRSWRWIERMSPVSVFLVACADLFFTDMVITGCLALFAAVIQGIRLAGWYSNKIWAVPLVWILHLAYAWIVIGFVLKAFALFELNVSILSLHALTVGGIGVMTLGMMARVSLGHTGREMKLDRWMSLAFVILNLAAVFRVILPVLIQDYYLQLINIAGWLWAIAFTLFIVVYAPMWLQSRIDGREG